MRKQIKLDVEVGDANYVKPGEYFGELAPNGKDIVTLKKRNDKLELVTLLNTPTRLEKGTAQKSISSLKANDKLIIEPSKGYDGLSRVIITFKD